jgi:GDP-4-dehydro-6-deoxy-D-mannose reductase
MRLIVTGAHGFAGSHVAASVRRVCGQDTDILLTSRHGAAAVGIEALDILDEAALAAALGRHRATHVLNLAGVAAPAAAAHDPDLAWQVHLQGVRCLARAIRHAVPGAVLVNAGTGLVYGGSFASGRPLSETALVEPLDEYGASKAAGDLALGVAARAGLRCLRMRPFNHSGPGQSEDFAVPAFAAQIARIEAGSAEGVLRVGNLDAARDFVDVRDVCDAYALALLKAREIEPGTVLNVASGVPRRMGDLLEELLALSAAPIRVEPDPARMRPSDFAVVAGDPGRAAALLDWSPRIPFKQTLSDVLDDWRARVARSVDGTLR